MKAILVTAFEPFGGEDINPSEMVLGMLPYAIGRYSIRKLVLPVEHDRSVEIAAAEYDRLHPTALIMLGQAGGRSVITPETTAKSTVYSGGEHGTLSSTLPVDRIVDALTARGIPCEASNDAGTYVCNTLFYRMLEHNGGEVPTGFVHVPYIREQGHADKPFMEIADIRTGIETIIETVAAAVTETASEQITQGQIVIRELRPGEEALLKDFLYEAIFIPEGVESPAREIVEQPELRIYYEDWGSGKADYCLVAEENGRPIGAVWTRIMNDYGHVDDETPSFAISLYREYRGRSIGTKLMKEMLKVLKNEGFERASLAVQKANFAVKMYENVGFEAISENDEEYIMVNTL